MSFCISGRQIEPLRDPVFFRLDGIVGSQGLQDCGRGYNHRSVHWWRDRCCKRDPWEDDQEICEIFFIIFIIFVTFIILIISIMFTISILFITWYHHLSYDIMWYTCFFLWFIRMELPNLKVKCELCEKHFWKSFVIRKHTMPFMSFEYG